MPDPRPAPMLAQPDLYPAPRRRGGPAAVVMLAHAGLLAALLAAGSAVQRVDDPAASAGPALQVALLASPAPRPATATPMPAPPRIHVPSAPPVPVPAIETDAVVPAAPQPAVVAAMRTTPGVFQAETPAPVPPPPTAPRPGAPHQVDVRHVAYLTPPVLPYPALSRRLREQGRVEVRVLVDEAGLPRETWLQRSSGHDRLDDAALAAVRMTRFRPHTEDGVPRPFWVVMPLVFELEP